MANNDTAVLYIKLSDLGTISASHKDLKAFKGTFDSLQKDMNRPAGKGKGGWKNAMMGSNEYDVARGSAGATGASGRDFANQARGLDGLVRLYATYAANVFAAGAAFRALSNAADTTNMIKGMDQLGASSGQALGTIAKRYLIIYNNKNYQKLQEKVDIAEINNGETDEKYVIHILGVNSK